MRHVSAKTNGFDAQRTVWRVCTRSQLSTEWQPELAFLVRITRSEELEGINRLASAGVGRIAVIVRDEGLLQAAQVPVVLEEEESLYAGDVVAVAAGLTTVHVLFRLTDHHHTVFLTNRCNSNCLMCSQPPTRHDDSWLIDEALHLARHLPTSPQNIGFTGGEPLLLGSRLREVLDTYSQYHPTTTFDLLTNGRRLADRELAKTLLADLSGQVTWMVPLYGHASFLHDYIVQRHGAFEETIDGLLSLHAYQQPIQLRIVLIKPVLEVLPALCEFIAKNLPFVSEVALMVCEPIGFALANRDHCELDIREWGETLEKAIARLRWAGLAIVIMNAPLCSLPKSLWAYAHRSISDWKQTYISECTECSVNERCAGLFTWHERGWQPTTIQAVKEYA